MTAAHPQSPVGTTAAEAIVRALAKAVPDGTACPLCHRDAQCDGRCPVRTAKVWVRIRDTICRRCKLGARMAQAPIGSDGLCSWCARDTP